jgi:hypothetical protein
MLMRTLSIASSAVWGRVVTRLGVTGLVLSGLVVAGLVAFGLAVPGHAAVFPADDSLQVTIAGERVRPGAYLIRPDSSRPDSSPRGEVANDVLFDADGEIPKLSAAPPWAMTFLALLLVSSGYVFLGARAREPVSGS